MRLGAAAPAALAVAVAAGACGGGTKALTYPQFQRAANAVCRRYSQRVDAIARPRTLAAVAQLARRAAALGAQERAALGKIPPPRGAAAGYADLLRRSEQADRLLPALRRAAERGDDVRVQRLAVEGRADVRRANAAAAKLGLDDCKRR